MGNFHITDAALRCLWCNRANYRRTVDLAHENVTLSGAANLVSEGVAALHSRQRPGGQTKDVRSYLGTSHLDRSSSAKLATGPISHWRI